MTSRIVCLGLALALSACGGDDEPESMGAPMGGDCESSTDTYATFGNGFFETYCNNCHGTGGTDPLAATAFAIAPFDSVEQIRAKKDTILSRLFHATLPMPPATAAQQPTAEQKNRAAAWVSCEAP